jgi:hypothetical protein
MHLDDAEPVFAGGQVVGRPFMVILRAQGVRTLATPAFATPTARASARLRTERSILPQFAGHVARVLTDPPHLL